MSRAAASALGAFLIGRLAVAVLLTVLTLPAVAAWPSPAWGRSFPDVPPGHPYAGAIADVSARGIMVGYADGGFGPADPVTRRQFAKMIVLALGLPVTENDRSPFSDVAPPPALTPSTPTTTWRWQPPTASRRASQRRISAPGARSTAPS